MHYISIVHSQDLLHLKNAGQLDTVKISNLDNCKLKLCFSHVSVVHEKLTFLIEDMNDLFTVPA
jgi:hypothetical protein